MKNYWSKYEGSEGEWIKRGPQGLTREKMIGKRGDSLYLYGWFSRFKTPRQRGSTGSGMRKKGGSEKATGEIQIRKTMAAVVPGGNKHRRHNGILLSAEATFPSVDLV